MTDSPIGRVVREYEIRELLGTGGFGRVYRATHRPTGVERALKVLHEHVAADVAVLRQFLREARASDALRHEHIVRVLEVFEHEDRLWIVMDHIEGRTLLHHLAESGALPVDEALDLARAVASALDHAHDRGIVHCDIKPGNVLLREADGAALLTDFGLARLRSETTQSMWSVAGTLTYMSPEQLGLNGGAVDRRSDVYAFTALVYEMLSGQPPYGRGVESLAGYHGRLTPRPLGGRRGLPDAVDGLVARGLHQDPEQRPQSAGALVRELQALVAEEPTRATPVATAPEPEPALRAAGWRPRPRADAVATAALLLIAVVPAGTVLPATSFSISASSNVSGDAFSRDGRLMADTTGALGDSMLLYDPATGQQIGQELFDGHAPIESLAFSPNDRMVAAGDVLSGLGVWDTTTGLPISQPLVTNDGAVDSLAFSPDGSLLASGGDSGARLWDPATSQPVGHRLASPGPVVSLAFSPDGKLLAGGTPDGLILLWDPATGQLVGQPLAGTSGAVNALAFSPDGRLLASGSDDGLIRLWNPKTGRWVGPALTGHDGPVSSLSFSPDGSLLASGSTDQTVRLWNPSTGQPVGRPLVGHIAEVLAVEFTTGGDLLATGNDGTSLWTPLP